MEEAGEETLGRHRKLGRLKVWPAGQRRKRESERTVATGAPPAAMAAMVGAHHGAWRPRRQTVEHVARAMEPDLESVFGIFRAHSDLGASRKVVLL